MNISGPLLKERASKFALELALESSFKSSNGWLELFLKCHNIAFETRSGEWAEVNQDSVQERKKQVRLGIVVCQMLIIETEIPIS